MVSQALLTAKHGSYAIGQEQTFAFIPSDPRWIKRDGSVISQANYPSLFAVYYCGDALNDTADFGYRCTNPADPDNTRDTAGTYVVLENADGRFDRGVIPGGARAMWSYEEDQMQGHRHSTLSGNTFLQAGPGGVNSVNGAGADLFYGNTTGDPASDGTNGAPRTGDETRPKNSAKIPMIFTGKWT